MISIPAVTHGYQPHLVAFRLDWKVLAGLPFRNHECTPSLPLPPCLPERLCHLSAPSSATCFSYLASDPAMPYAPTNLQGLRHIISAFRALPASLPRSRRSVLFFAPFVLWTCTLTMFVVVLKHGQRLANRPVTSEEQHRLHPTPKPQLGQTPARTRATPQTNTDSEILAHKHSRSLSTMLVLRLKPFLSLS
jgi:hypothetical protein